jgi:hypothetical protein
MALSGEDGITASGSTVRRGEAGTWMSLSPDCIVIRRKEDESEECHSAYFDITLSHHAKSLVGKGLGTHAIDCHVLGCDCPFEQ